MKQARTIFVISIAFNIAVPVIFLVFRTVNILVPWPVGGTTTFDPIILIIPLLVVGVLMSYFSYVQYKRIQERASIEIYQSEMHDVYWDKYLKRMRKQDKKMRKS